ncbi:MinD/ParA family protein [Corynebacteriales bacterium D3-21]|uniref:MinD/ParA family protein n=1 Tax=Speluncibacter jeojiensis TaxID=2710754 RepID=A0A9X4M6S5_9ACTN|nr:MinD/ParA family protein [Corynebacteriales bacterium D3-21]
MPVQLPPPIPASQGAPQPFSPPAPVPTSRPEPAQAPPQPPMPPAPMPPVPAPEVPAPLAPTVAAAASVSPAPAAPVTPLPHPPPPGPVPPGPPPVAQQFPVQHPDESAYPQPQIPQPQIPQPDTRQVAFQQTQMLPPQAQPPLPYQPPAPQADPMAAPGSGIDELDLLHRARRAPQSGWRRAVFRVSGGAVNPGESPEDIAQRELIDRVNQPIRGDYRIAVLSLKGGVGKTTTTIGLGSTFASLRGDRVIAVDANPDLGTLAQRIPRQTMATVRDLLQDPSIHRYSDVRAYTSQAPSRLEVLASEQDPSVSEAFSEHDYRSVIKILQSYYNVILTDCGTGLMHSAMNGVLGMASSLVLVSSPAIDGARSASATLDWLTHHGYRHLVDRTVVVISATRTGSGSVDLDELRRLFLDRCRAVQFVPFDDHLAEGAEIDLELCSKSTRRAFTELAAMVADDFPAAAGRHTIGGPAPR